MDKKLIILLSGKLSSGKNTTADILKEELENHFKEKVALDSFARPLKEMCQKSFKPLIDYLNQMFKTVYEMEGNFGGYEFDKLITEEKHWWEEKTPISRILLQQTGTELFRDHVSKNYWVELFKKNSKSRIENIVINSDTRFLGEIEYLESCDDINVITIRVERNIERNNTFNEHVSETALDDYKDWNIIIRNDGTLEELRSNIKDLVTKEHTYDYPGRNMFSRYIK